MKKIKYVDFGTFVLRTPMFPFQYYEKKVLSTNPLFKEAIYLASETLYKELYICPSKRKNHKVDISEYKYQTRSCTRCTPFGLFACCSIGEIGKDTLIDIGSNLNLQRSTRLDMQILDMLLNKLIGRMEFRLKENLKYFPNDSIYKIGNTFRYVEYYEDNNHIRKHQISSTEASLYLQHLLKFANTGKRISELISFLQSFQFSKSESLGYVNELIDSQILKNEFCINLTGEFLLDRIVRMLNTDSELSVPLSKLKSLVNNLDCKIINNIQSYENIKANITKLDIKTDLKSIFQTDVYRNNKTCKISKEFVENIIDTIQFLSKLPHSVGISRLDKFKDKFIQKFGVNRQIALSLALDPEIGVQYGDPYILADNVLLKDIPLYQNESHQISVDELQFRLLDKIVNSQREAEIVLSDDDFKDFKEDLNDLPDTISALCRMYKNDNKLQFELISIGGTTAANLLGRFSHINKGIEDLVESIFEKEQEIRDNYIVAEIVHSPEARTGNILHRKVCRKYEIHYLANSVLANEFQIPISDLQISVVDQLLVLTSKKLKKKILPRLSTAHNFNLNSLPIYRFLCEMQFTTCPKNLFFQLGDIFSSFDDIPRIRYKNCILSRKKWRIKKQEFELLHITDNDIEKIGQWRTRRGIPRYALFCQGDNELLIDFNSVVGLKAFFDILKTNKAFYLQEFLFKELSPVATGEGGTHYCNEIILPLMKIKND